MSEPDGGKKRKGQGGRGGGGEGGDKGNKKAKYYASTRGGTGQAIPLGTRGILVTCDAGREDRAGDEATALIEEHYDKLAAANPGSAAGGGESGGEGKDGGGDGGGKDIAALLAAEVAELKDKSNRRFKVHMTGVKGVIYVVFPDTPGPDPVDVVLAIVKEAQERKQVRGRFIVRFLPVTATCFASLDEIKAAAPKAIGGHFPDAEDAAPIEYAVEYEHRSSEGFQRLDVINAFTGVIKSPPHKVNLKAPTKTVLVQLIRNGCAVAVVPSYKELAKYNVRKLAEVEEEGQGGKAAAAEAKEGAKEEAKKDAE